jgi:S-formylglutathione hydrolase FrmB
MGYFSVSLVKFNFESYYLKGKTNVSIVLPDKPRKQDPVSYYQSGETYKVLWLLHGTYGDDTDWVRKSMVEVYAKEKNLILIMPAALNTNYSNWPKFSLGFDMYSFLIDELMPVIYNWFPVASCKREDNYIAGLSMGGRGALVYGLNAPEKFAAVACLSAAPFDVENLDSESDSHRANRMRVIAENAGGMDAYLASRDNSWRLCRELAGDSKLPRFYFAIGKDDFLYNNWQKFRAFCEDIDFKATFEEYDGFTHEWRFWDLTIQRAIEFFGLKDNQGGTF